MTPLMKQSLRAVSPSLYRLLRDRYREYAPYNRLVQHIAGGLDWNVESGPFAGMKYLPGFCEGILPKLLGSYEQELWPALHSIASLPIQAVINIGCAEGYYAVGLARLLPNATIYAFDCLPTARDATRRAAEVNHVTARIRIAGACDSATLATLPLEGALVVIDCEGAEFEILDPSVAPGLAASWLLVELHDFVDCRITPALRARFSSTHEIEIINAAVREPGLFPALAGLAAPQQTMALNEDRHWKGVPERSQWAFMAPRPRQKEERQ